MFVSPGKYYPIEEEEEGPNLTTIVEQHVHHMNNCMRSNVTTKTMLDVESKVGLTVLYLPVLREFVDAFLDDIFSKVWYELLGSDFTHLKKRKCLAIDFIMELDLTKS